MPHVPVIFNSNGRYCREHSRYLRESERASNGIPVAALTFLAAERSAT